LADAERLNGKMLRLHGAIGRESDDRFRTELHHLAHHDAIERLFVPEAELGRRRFRLSTDKGTDCAVSLDRDEVLADGTLLFLDQNRAVVVRVGAPKILRLRPATKEAALSLGWSAGHLHWRVRFEDGDLVVLLDGPIADYRVRIASLIKDGSVGEVDGH
jgi:urease accessory protein